MYDFLFYRSQFERGTCHSSFSSLNFYMSKNLRYSKKGSKKSRSGLLLFLLPGTSTINPDD